MNALPDADALIQAGRATPAQALALFDRLEPLRADALLGRWSGQEIATGHPMDGLLEPGGWYGKAFFAPDDVHPLLIWRLGGRSVFSLHPGWMRPVDLTTLPRWTWAGTALRALAPLVRTTRGTARLREVAFRGAPTAAMLYDDLPIVDAFRRIDERRVLGLMDRRGDPPDHHYTFVLTRDDDGPALD